MGLINKCSACENKGFLLKLEKGLCPNCLSDLKNIESEYTTLLQSISINPNDKTNNSNTLSKLIPNITKFSNYSNILNMDVVSQLITSLSVNKLADNFNSSSPSINKVSSDNKNIDCDDCDSIDTNYVDYTSGLEPLDNNLNLQLSLKEDFSSYIESSDNLLENESSNDLLNPSDKIIMDNIYSNTSDIISVLSNTNLSLNELGRNFFKLKNTFYPVLKQYNINEVNGTIITDYINSTEKRLCHLTSRSSDTLYDFFNYAILSIQTSGLNVESNYILELSALKINYGEIVDEFYTLINPMKTINPDITKKTGITYEMVASSPTLDIALLKLKEFIEDYNLVIYNSANVLSFLNFYYNNLFGYTLKNKDTCCLRLYRSRYKNYHGEPVKISDLYSICLDMLTEEDLHNIEDFNSMSKSTSYAVYKLFEILKSRYK